ncbi:PBP superfamily domain protein [uncultured archaeon]|nr:PBP superfamily domain protein [uncultured archaeon]
MTIYNTIEYVDKVYISFILAITLVIQINQQKEKQKIGMLLISLLVIFILGATLFSGCVQQQGQQGQSIVLIGRDSTSGTREFFWTFVMGKANFSASLLEKNSNGAVQQTIAQTPSAIGYVGLGYVDSTVKALTINNITANVQNVLAGAYPISRDLYMFTKGNSTGAAKEFILFMQSIEGQAIVTQEGFVPLQNTVHYNVSGKTLSGTLTVSGSTTVLPITDKVATAFKALNPGLMITVTGGGSGAGISAVSQGTVDIGMSSRDLQSSESNLGLVKHVIAKDGIVIIVNPSNNYVNNLSLAQLKAIYKGEITNWKDLSK